MAAEKAQRITLKRGPRTQRFVITDMVRQGEWRVKVGSEVYMNGSDQPWTVVGIDDTEIIARIPIRRTA